MYAQLYSAMRSHNVTAEHLPLPISEAIKLFQDLLHNLDKAKALGGRRSL